MEEPKLAYGQCITTAFEDQRRNYFQRMLWDFTFKIYHIAIKPDVARGHTAPFVGHNAFLSWAAIDACKVIDPGTGSYYWWSESHVSEDFDMAMRMMAAGYVGRYIAYAPGFEEGISLTFPEEEKKVTKFAYGAAEMLLNPLKQWPFRGPVSPLFRSYVRTRGVSAWSKIKMLLYMLEYFGIALAPVFAAAEGLCVVALGPGMWAGYLGLVRAFEVVVFNTAIFMLASPAGAIVFTMRAKIKPQSSLLSVIWGECKYAVPTAIQWTSYSFKFAIAITRYMLSMPMPSWGATSKEFDSDVFSDNEFWDVLIPVYSTQILLGALVYAAWSMFLWQQAINFTEGFGVLLVALSYMTAPFILNPNLIRLRF